MNKEIHIKLLEDLNIEYHYQKDVGSKLIGRFKIKQPRDLMFDLSDHLGLFDLYFDEIPFILQDVFINCITNLNPYFVYSEPTQYTYREYEFEVDPRHKKKRLQLP